MRGWHCCPAILWHSTGTGARGLDLGVLGGDGRQQEDGALHSDGLVVVGPVGLPAAADSAPRAAPAGWRVLVAHRALCKQRASRAGVRFAPSLVRP